MLRDIELQTNPPAAPAADDDGDGATLLSTGSSSSGPVPGAHAPWGNAGGGGGGGGGAPSSPMPTSRVGRALAALNSEPLLLHTVCGVVLGIAVGAIARAGDASPRAVELIGFPAGGLTLVHFSAQPEPFLTQNAP